MIIGYNHIIVGQVNTVNVWKFVLKIGTIGLTESDFFYFIHFVHFTLYVMFLSSGQASGLCWACTILGPFMRLSFIFNKPLYAP